MYSVQDIYKDVPNFRKENHHQDNIIYQIKQNRNQEFKAETYQIHLPFTEIILARYHLPQVCMPKRPTWWGLTPQDIGG